jgi:hypothetical protein
MDPRCRITQGREQRALLDSLGNFGASRIRNTAPYFHDNSAKTLEDVVRHYALLFAFVSNNVIVLSEEDQADIVAFLKLLRGFDAGANVASDARISFTPRTYQLAVRGGVCVFGARQRPVAR